MSMKMSESLYRIRHAWHAVGILTRYKKRKAWLTGSQVDTILGVAGRTSPRDYAMMTLMRWGLRVGEIVGCEGLPGIHLEDIRSEGIWVKGKLCKTIWNRRLAPNWTSPPQSLLRNRRQRQGKGRFDDQRPNAPQESGDD